MQKNHYLAFLANAALCGFDYEKRDGEPTLEEINSTLTRLGTTFAEFQTKNDERLKQVEKKGVADPLTEDAVQRIVVEMTEIKDIRDNLAEMSRRAARPGGGGNADGGENETKAQRDHRDAFVNLLRTPNSPEAKAALEQAEKAAGAEAKAKVEAGERKAVTTTTDSSGGHAVPEVISRRIERELSEVSPLRNYVDVQQAGSKDFKILVDVRGTGYGWVGETDNRDETGTSGLEEVAPDFGMIYAYPKASEESLDDMFFDVENWLIMSILEAFAEGEENAIINGNGVKKPTGILNGVPTEQQDGDRPFGTFEYVRSRGAAGFAADNPQDAFRDMATKLKKGYRRNASWLMNKLTVGEVMKFKDADGRYLWQPSLILDQPDRFLAYPLIESEEMPDIAANDFPVAFGDLKAAYVLCDLVGFRLTRDEVTTPGFVKWYARRRLGGKPKKTEALKLMKMEAAA